MARVVLLFLFAAVALTTLVPLGSAYAGPDEGNCCGSGDTQP